MRCFVCKCGKPILVDEDIYEIHCKTQWSCNELGRAYDKKALEQHGEFAFTNFPKGDYQ